MSDNTKVDELAEALREHGAVEDIRTSDADPVIAGNEVVVWVTEASAPDGQPRLAHLWDVIEEMDAEVADAVPEAQRTGVLRVTLEIPVEVGGWQRVPDGPKAEEVADVPDGAVFQEAWTSALAGEAVIVYKHEGRYWVVKQEGDDFVDVTGPRVEPTAMHIAKAWRGEGEL